MRRPMYQRENLSKMQPNGPTASGMDVVIVSANNPDLESYWQERLEQGKGTITKTDTYVLAVYEDYPGGAGNGLGTLYSFQKACEKALHLYNIDLNQLMIDGASVALYHTAGKGTRTSPLTGSEHNDKSAIKLPGLVQDDQLMTLLEAVIKQTAIYAPSRQGRLSVFWGDQVFIPSSQADYSPTHHIDILAQLFSFPSEEEWNQKELSKYGLIAVHQGNAQNVEKGDYQTICQLIANRKILADQVGLSLGSFSLSHAIVLALLNEFKEELKEKKVKLDSDPHFWMAMTLDQQTYTEVMTKKNMPEKEALAHHQRIQAFKNQFIATQPVKQLFGAVDIGKDSYWWDYGSIQSYLSNNLKLTSQGDEAEIMRQFFKTSLSQETKNSELKIDSHSILINCQIQSGQVSNCVLVNVTAKHIDASECVALNTMATEIFAKYSLTYNVIEHKALTLSHAVRADCYLPVGTEHKVIAMQTDLARDGQADWKIVVAPNLYSYETVNQLNQTIPLKTALEAMAEARQRAQPLQPLAI
jgi:hypothetical protein